MATLDRLFLSRSRAEVLRILFGVTRPEMHVRAIERASGLTINAIRVELAKLRELDLVVERRDGNRLYYAANRSHPFHDELRSIVLKTSGLRDVLTDALQGLPIRVAFVFGSVACDEEKARSDVDLMVIGEVGLRAIARALQGVSEKIGREANAVTMTPKEFKERLAKNDAFLQDVMAKPKIFVIGDVDDLAAMA
jgi:predicted nucleotidyltransferase